MSNYTTGEIAQKCSVSVRTVQYYDKQGILSPSQMTDANRRLYTDQEVKKLELIILLKELGCSIKDIRLLLKNNQSLKALNAMLKVKEEELQEDIKSKEVIIKKIKDICKYFNTTSNSPITHLYDIDHVMKQTSNLNSFRKKCGLVPAL
ncbi:MerR family transcriptional regulator [Staphylococcus capitis]|uniref:MerR family transcriptional regulator n=1 Tax=Staphylococcus capitis TaxID=29388 RepID=UPI0006585BB4